MGKKISQVQKFFSEGKKINYGGLNGKNFFPRPKFFRRGKKKLVWRFEWEKIFPGCKKFLVEEKFFHYGGLNGKKIFLRPKIFLGGKKN
jgi:hypothetical protein